MLIEHDEIIEDRHHRPCGDRGRLFVAVIDSTVKLAAEVTVTLTEEERRQRARQAIAEAFAERPPRVVEGEYTVIGGRDVASDVAAANERVQDNRDAVTANCGEQAKGEAAEEREG
jgi:hypothetical protein